MKPKRYAWMTLVLSITAAAAGGTVTAGTFPGANGKIAFSTGDVEVINPDGTGRVNLTTTGVGGESEPAWDATGTKLVFGDSGHSFSTMNADGSNVEPLVGMDHFAGNPTWSADGSVVAFDHFVGSMEGNRIYVVPASSGTATELVGLDARDPSYSPDGSKIAFEHRDAPGIGVMDADGSNVAAISIGDSGNAGDFDPSWSPDGTKIAFTRAHQIWSMNSDGGSPMQLTSLPDLASYPTWSPDGTQIAFESDNDIWVMDQDGSDAVNITNTPDEEENEPDWGGTAPPAEGIQFSVDAFAGSENDGGARTLRGAVITVVRTGSTVGTASVRFVTSDGSAKSSSVRKCRACKVSPPDYVRTTGTLVFGDGESTKTFQVPILDDGAIENDETVNLTLKPTKSGAALGSRTTATLTIHDNDPNVSFQRASSRGPEAAVTTQLKVLFSTPEVGSVDYSVTGGTATAGDDFTLAAGTLNFGGQKGQAIKLAVLDDNLKEPDETVRVELSSPTNVELGPISVHTFTIEANDPQGDVAGDTPDTALPLDLVAQPRQVIGESLFPTNADVDVFRVHLEAEDDLAIDVDPVGKGLGGLLSSTLTILGSDGTTELAVVGGSPEPDGSGATENPAHLFHAPAAGDYYLRLSSGEKEVGQYRMELHRLALHEGVQDPKSLDEEGPMYAWLRGDTLGITGPTGYGFSLQGAWTQETKFFKKTGTTSALYTLAAGEEVDLLTAFGELRLVSLGPVTVPTNPNLWGDLFGEVGTDPIPLRMGVPIDALADDLRDEFGLELQVSALERWNIMMGSEIMEGGRGLPSGIHETMPGIPYLVFNDKPAISAIFGDIYIEQPALDKKVLMLLEPVDPFLYIRVDEAKGVKAPTLAFSRRGHIPFTPDLVPTIPDAVGLTDFYSHVFASGGVPPNPALKDYITIFADGSVDLDANDDGNWLAGEGNAHELASGDLSALGNVLRDINLGANGRVIFHYNSEIFDFETALGRASAVYNGGEEAIWFRGRKRPEESPFAGTPLSFLKMTQEDFIEGTIRSDGQFAVKGGTRFELPGDGLLHIQIDLDNEGIAADVNGRVELKGSAKIGGVTASCKAGGEAQGLFSFSYSNRLHMSGSLELDGSVKCYVNGKKVASASFDIGGRIDDGKIVFKFPFIGNKSIRLF